MSTQTLSKTKTVATWTYAHPKRCLGSLARIAEIETTLCHSTGRSKKMYNPEGKDKNNNFLSKQTYNT